MRRVVITGIGIVSCLGNNKKEVLDSLLKTKSGIVFSEEYKNYNFKSQVCGAVKINIDDYIDRKDKNKPVQTLEERRIQLEAVKYIDEIIEYETENDLHKLLFELDPHVRILGSDWKGKPFTGYSLHIPIYFHERDHDYSTSDLRKRIVES